jgi:octaprenyl-diphosphate synthase
VISETPTVTLADLQAGLGDRLAAVRAEIARLVAADLPLITDVNAHLLQMQGKLFRPTLVFLVEDAVGAPDPRTVRLAATVELIHLATLVHDDAVDHSVLRRGMPTVNAVFSHQVSVIMGDYLYSRAVIELVRLEDLEPLRVLSRVTNEMTVGEMRQLLAHDRLRFTEEEYNLLIRSKTASLLSGAAEVGALRAPPPERRAAARFGEYLGMVFQIVDDLLDFTGNALVTGKPSGGDLREHKVTLPLIHAFPRMDAAAQARVVRLMEMPDPTNELIEQIIADVGAAGGLRYARQRAQEFAMRAEAELEALPPSAGREALRAAVTYVLERRN